MDEKRKTAYRALIYHFFLDVRTVPLPLTDDDIALRLGHYAGPLAYQLHNLALASVQNFDGFDESQFWIDLEAFGERNSKLELASHYRKVFEHALSGHY